MFALLGDVVFILQFLNKNSPFASWGRTILPNKSDTMLESISLLW